MKTIKIRKFSDIEDLANNLEERIIVDFSECENKIKIRALDFLTGLTFENGSLKKLSTSEFMITKGDI